MTQFEDKARLAEFESSMEDWRAIEEYKQSRPSLQAMTTGDASRFCGCFSKSRTYAADHVYAD